MFHVRKPARTPTSLPVLRQPSMTDTKFLLSSLNRIRRVRGSSTCHSHSSIAKREASRLESFVDSLSDGSCSHLLTRRSLVPPRVHRTALRRPLAALDVVPHRLREVDPVLQAFMPQSRPSARQRVCRTSTTPSLVSTGPSSPLQAKSQSVLTQLVALSEQRAFQSCVLVVSGVLVLLLILLIEALLLHLLQRHLSLLGHQALGLQPVQIYIFSHHIVADIQVKMCFLITYHLRRRHFDRLIIHIIELARHGLHRRGSHKPRLNKNKELQKRRAQSWRTLASQESVP